MNWDIFSLDDPYILENAETIDHITLLTIIYFLKRSVVERWLYGFFRISLQLLDKGCIAVELDIYIAEVEVLIGGLPDKSASQSVKIALL